jgi:hypothetical protein
MCGAYLLIARESLTAHVILSIAYGIDVLPENDPYVADAETLVDALAIGTTKEATLLDAMPWCTFCRVI